MSALKVSPRTSTMTLRSACDGSCGSPQDTDSSSPRSGRSTRRSLGSASRRHHQHHSHHHHSQVNGNKPSEPVTIGRSFQPSSPSFVSFSKALKPKERSVFAQVLAKPTIPVLRQSHMRIIQEELDSSSVRQCVRTEERSSSTLRVATWDLNRGFHLNSPSSYSSAGVRTLEASGDATKIEGQLENSRSNMIGLRSYKESDMSSNVSSRSWYSLVPSSCGSVWGSARRRSMSNSTTSTPINDRMVNSNMYMENGSVGLGRQPLTGWTMHQSYGLDEESEEEMLKISRRCIPIKERRKSGFYLLLERSGRFLHPLVSGWYSFWSTVYWWITLIHLCDTWILVRTRHVLKKAVTKLWKFFIPLLLLLPVILGGISFQKDDVYRSFWGNESIIKGGYNIWDFSFSYLFPNTVPSNYDGTFTGNSDVTETFNETWRFDSESVRKLFREIVIQIYGKPDDSVNPNVVPSLELNYTTAKLLLQDIIREELEVILGNLSDYQQWKINQETKNEVTTAVPQPSQEQNEALISEIIRVEKQVDALESLTGSLREDLEALKIKDEIETEQYRDNTAWNEESKAKIEHLETVIQGLKDNALVLEKQFLASVRNCCKNHTEYVAFVDKQIAIALNKLSENQDPNTRRWYMNIRTLLEDHFVAKDDMSVFKNSVTEKVVGALAAIDLDARIRSAVQEAVVAQSENVAYDAVFSNAVRGIFKQEIALYSADRTGLPDYALESSGGSVISTRCSETHQTHTAQFSIFGIPLWYYNNSPRTVIQPGVNPGECWAFKGSTGYLVIQLSGRVKITAVSLEHIPKSISPSGNIDSAPKEFSVKGLETEMSEGVLLGNFTYNDSGPSLQTFAVEKVDPERAFPIVELIVSSNHGNLEYTCLYRFRVHGSLLTS